MNSEIRTIQKEDNPFIAKIIRDTLTEFKANKPGTVFFDESTDRLSELFSVPKSMYYICMIDGRIVGGAGIYPTDGLPNDTCELVKMYILPDARGKGLGKALINTCVEFAQQQGYKKIYLETMPELARAVSVYEQLGFTSLSHSLGNSGHFGCAIWMLKEIVTTQHNTDYK